MTLLHRNLRRLFVTAALLVATLAACSACKRDTKSSPASGASAEPRSEGPTVRLYVISTLAGAMEPCGCVKDMLGGVDHAAALIASQRKGAPHRLVLGAGPMLFMEPELEGDKKTQDLWKAEAIAAAMADMGLAAWAPGYNDFAAGTERLSALAKKADAALIGANLAHPQLPGHKVFTVGQTRVGVAGVTAPLRAGSAPKGVEARDLIEPLRKALSKLEEAGAEVRVALVAADRGEALRLAERVPGFHVMVVGKPFDQGEGNDAPTPPVLVEKTLVVQAPNHLQGVGVVDLFVREGFDFADGSGVSKAEQKKSLELRLASLEKRITAWERDSTIDPKDLAARKQDVVDLRAAIQALSQPEAPKSGSYFRYELERVREELGRDEAVAKRMDAYYRRVNEHNQQAFADRTPPPVPEGQSGYLGAEDCSNCHDEEHAFWKKTPHASAYATLVKQHKEFNLDCVSCHVTGYEKPGGTTVTHVSGLESVQCEVCHGPGSRHEDDPENPDLIQKVPEKSLCQKCHHPPHVKDDWSVDEAWPKILGEGHGK